MAFRLVYGVCTTAGSVGRHIDARAEILEGIHGMGTSRMGGIQPRCRTPSIIATIRTTPQAKVTPALARS